MKKKYMLLLVILPILLLAMFAFNIPTKAAYPTTYVKIYTDPAVIPFATPGTKITFDVMIETHGMTDMSAYSIIGWGFNLQVDPTVLNVSLLAEPFPNFPKAKVSGATSGYFIWQTAQYTGGTANLLPGSSDYNTGFWWDISEQILPAPSVGGGDIIAGMAPKLATFEMTSLNDTQPCLIDIVRAVYFIPGGAYYPIDIVVDGFYGAQPTYMSETTGVYTPTEDPTGTTWHEDYPDYCKLWNVYDWTDNGDQRLSASDQLDMVNETGYVYFWHVDAVTTTIHWTFKTEGGGVAEPYDNSWLNNPEANPDYPIGSSWHQIYPDYCKWFTITSWEDNDENGEFNPSDQFDFSYEDEPQTTYWAHLDSVTTDIILSYKGEGGVVPEFPLGLGLMIAMAPAIPIVYLWRLRRKVTKR